MKLLCLALLAAAPLSVLAQDWNGVSLLDANCKAQAKDAAAHPRSCLLKCKDSGYGVVTGDGKWIPLDAKGNSLAVAALEKSKKADHVQVNVSGEMKGEKIAVSQLALAD
jgi:hypothetical protein